MHIYAFIYALISISQNTLPFKSLFVFSKEMTAFNQQKLIKLIKSESNDSKKCSINPLNF